MDQSYSESDVSLSPSQILERLQVLRQLQLLQRGKLQKQRLEYQETSENSSGLTEIVSHFSTSTSYNTFRSLLETANDSSNDATPRSVATSVSAKVRENDLVEGVSVLNLSQESEFIVNSPTSARSAISSKNSAEHTSPNSDASGVKPTNKKHISLDDMPVLTPKKDFEALILEKLKSEVNRQVIVEVKKSVPAITDRKPFLRKGEGTSRFGVQKKDLVIQNTKSLPWRKNSKKNLNLSKVIKNGSESNNKKVKIDIMITKPENSLQKLPEEADKSTHDNSNKNSKKVVDSKNLLQVNGNSSEHSPITQPPKIIQTKQKDKHSLLSNKGKTWASVLSNDQNDFLCKLKQSDYYKNFASPAKSTVSDASNCDEYLIRLINERENAEQNMFDLLESKVSHESFSLENSFFNRFLRRNQLECSGESTPLVLQQCLAKNPDLRTLLPNILHRNRNEDSHTDIETNAECSDCCSETCSTVSSCCSCKTVEQNNSTHIHQEETPPINKAKHVGKKVLIRNNSRDKAIKDSEKKGNDNVKEDTEMKANMVEMNAKLIATSELLKERLRELEDEIETFRKENANLTKMREEIDTERHKFYEEKTLFEQKFNEEKILSEYYISEEKEKLTKQKQLYDKYVREMRGRLNRKDKDEVINLKKEISDLKEEIRLKDAKSTSTIARLRNQIKIFEKEKKDFLDEIEKLKKENRRIQHSNDMTRRMTNIKYLEEINKKLSNMTAKDTQSENNYDSNAKYKAFEIERQSRLRNVQTTHNKPMRTRAKSVPNLKVTSRYAKYFSQRDVVSDIDKNNILNTESVGRYTCSPDDGDQSEEELQQGNDDDGCTDSEPEDNNLEKLYMDRFHSLSPKSVKSNVSNSSGKLASKSFQAGISHHNPDDFFISKSTSKNDCNLSNNVSPVSNSSEYNLHRSRPPASITSLRSSDQRSPLNSSQELYTNKMNIDQFSNSSNASNKTHTLSKSPVSILTNRSSSSHKPTTVVHKDYLRDTFNVTPEPTISRSSASKTNLNPTEIRKPDGSKELRFPNGNVKFISSDGQYSKFVYYNGDVKENFYNEGRIKYFYAETKTCHTTHADGLEVLEFPDGQVEKRYKDGSSEIRLPNGSIRYFDPKNEHVREEWRFPDGTAITVAASGEQRIQFSNGQVEVHAKDHKRREFPDGTVKLVYNDGTSETRYASGRVRIKDKHGNLIMDSATR